jgi:hypothetical protein
MLTHYENEVHIRWPKTEAYIRKHLYVRGVVELTVWQGYRLGAINEGSSGHNPALHIKIPSLGMVGDATGSHISCDICLSCIMERLAPASAVYLTQQSWTSITTIPVR